MQIWFPQLQGSSKTKEQERAGRFGIAGVPKAIPDGKEGAGNTVIQGSQRSKNRVEARLKTNHSTGN
jgi:hypothetical protein